jgi:Ca2+:H+ antiporter
LYVQGVRRKLPLFAGTAALSAVAGVLHFTTDAPVATFVVAGFALAGLAWVVGVGTETVGSRFGPAVTGVLQATLGNLPELFIVLFAIRAGEVVVAESSILGSLFANALLVLGLVVVAGTRRASGGVMRFGSRLPNDTASLLLLAVFIIVLLGLSNALGDPASAHQVEISVVGAVVLLLVYGVWLRAYLHGGAAQQPTIETGAVHLPFRAGVALLALAATGAAFVSDWFVAALAPAAETLGISRTFTGLVIVAIAGNAVENFVGVAMAMRGKAELAISIVKNAVAQIAVFLYPLLVLLSLFFEERLTFVVAPVFIGALAITALAVWQITGDGEATPFEGCALIGLYAILATVAWFE